MRQLTPKILVVDDDRAIVSVIRGILEPDGYGVVVAADGAAALAAFVKETPDLVLLDITLPDTDGYTICRRIRESSKVPIIMVSARDSDGEKIAGFRCGADDYVTKPFSVRELLARVKAILRRTGHGGVPSDSAAYVMDELSIDFARHRVRLGGEDINLSATEYRLLAYLSRNAGYILTSDEILASVWGSEYTGAHHLLRVNITRLRHKIGDDVRNPRFIMTRLGLGYMMPEVLQSAQEPRQLPLDITSPATN